MNEWNIQSRGHACQSCHAAFTDQQVYHTILFDEKRDFLRTDVCQKCWDAQFSESRDRKGFISCWHGEYQAPPPQVEAIQKGDAESLLRKLVEVNDPKHAAASYILAVMLERKRILKVKEQIRTEGKRTALSLTCDCALRSVHRVSNVRHRPASPAPGTTVRWQPAWAAWDRVRTRAS